MEVIKQNEIATIIRITIENWQQRFLAIKAEGWLEGGVGAHCNAPYRNRAVSMQRNRLGHRPIHR